MKTEPRDCTTCKYASIKGFCYLVCDIQGIMNDVETNCKDWVLEDSDE